MSHDFYDNRPPLKRKEKKTALLKGISIFFVFTLVFISFLYAPIEYIPADLHQTRGQIKKNIDSLLTKKKKDSYEILSKYPYRKNCMKFSALVLKSRLEGEGYKGIAFEIWQDVGTYYEECKINLFISHKREKSLYAVAIFDRNKMKSFVKKGH